MFDFIRNLAKSAEEKQLETLNAYLDGELSAREQRLFEEQLAEDTALRAELAQLRQVQQGIRQLPQARAPRNFTLDPAVYGRPQPQPAFELYPVLRVATALAAFFFIVAVVLDLATPAGGLGQPLAAVSSQQEPAAAEVEMAEEAARADQAPVTRIVADVVEGEPLEVTRVVTETVEEEAEMAAVAEEEAQEEAQGEVQDEALEEAPAEEEAMEAEIASEPADERTEEPVEQAAETEALTAPTDDATAADGEDGPAFAAPAAATETLPPSPTLTSEAPESEDHLPAEEPVDGDFPILLIAEIVFGVGLVVLLTVTLLVRRKL